MTGGKHIKLGQLADIINGIPDVKPAAYTTSPSITYNLIQPNHLGPYNNIQGYSVLKRPVPVNHNYLLRTGDILLKRLNPDNAVIVDTAPAQTIFSSNLFVIRVRDNYYAPYIASFLESLTWLNSNLVGSFSAIRSVSLKTLAELDIPDIAYERQQAVGHLWLLHKKRQRLLEDFKTQDQQLFTAVMNSITSR